MNNREYSTEVAYETAQLAQESAAMKAYMICRNFSANDGMYPGQRPGQRSSNGHIQGLPVAIGTGRRSHHHGHRDSVASYDAGTGSSGSSEGTNSGGNSPRSVESNFEQQMRQAIPVMPHVSSSSSHRADRTTTRGHMCPCGRGPAGRCLPCYQDRAWA